MDSTRNMIIANDKIITENVKRFNNNNTTRKMDITFNNGNTYSYNPGNVIFLSDPKLLYPEDYIVKTVDDRILFDIKRIYEFQGRVETYWHIVYGNGSYSDYKKSNLRITENCLKETKSGNMFDYLSEVAGLSNLRNDDGELILKKHYNRLSFVSETSALSVFLNPDKSMNRRASGDVIFPFGCNRSQFDAVTRALSNQISVIQGPPGTGKTQTILNIIANLIIRKKSVMVVSNNNSATLNVLEKLSKEKYGMDFMVATLGKAENRKAFIENQTGRYPDLSSWAFDEEHKVTLGEVSQCADRVHRIFELREEIAKLNDDIYKIDIEYKHFRELAKDTGIDYESVRVKKRTSSEKIMNLWQTIENKCANSDKISLSVKLKGLFSGIGKSDFYKRPVSAMITVLQAKYYEKCLEENRARLEKATSELENYKESSEKLLEEKSLSFLKACIEKRYDWDEARRVFKDIDLFKSPGEVLKEYPIVLSTTFSSRTSLNADEIEYDYVIMDEASQVDISTGALALSCAKNAVIVGDLKQLPNVVTKDVEEEADRIRNKYNINDAYDFAHKSFLQSVTGALPDAPSTLLKEHYRCHPRIISFCNQKFYDGNLMVMTEDDNLGQALMAVKTVEGNHARNNYNQRQIDVIKDEILPTLTDISKDEIGIITPYNDQVNAIRQQIPGIEVDTVHKYQGREKDVIILSTVDDEIRDFTDDPYLLNVAVSRAKKRLIVVVSGNKQEKHGNIVDLISYISYNKMEVIDSKIYSVFDFLYGRYTHRRWERLKKYKEISEYDSENLTYSLIKSILEDYPEYDVTCFETLSMVVRDYSDLSPDEVEYAKNPMTHIDFIIYNKFSKQPVLAVETDGYNYHKEGTVQHERDLKKNHILEVSGLKLVRLNTTGSNEKEKIISALEAL